MGSYLVTIQCRGMYYVTMYMDQMPMPIELYMEEMIIPMDRGGDCGGSSS